MSWEGYYVMLCESGHLRKSWDVYGFSDPLKTDACDCGAKFKWMCVVDETNGPDPETGVCPGEEKVLALEIEEQEVLHQCTCGHLHTLKERRYKIPAQGIPVEDPEESSPETANPDDFEFVSDDPLMNP